MKPVKKRLTPKQVLAKKIAYQTKKINALNQEKDSLNRKMGKLARAIVRVEEKAVIHINIRHALTEKAASL